MFCVERRCLSPRSNAPFDPCSNSNMKSADMPKQRRKSDLPTKTCATCGLPFTWRKKWEKVWDEVKYCSDRCRRAKAKP